MPALVRELIKDTRRMMAPYTALKLTERKSNSLKDFVALSGTLGYVRPAMSDVPLSYLPAWGAPCSG